MAVDFRNPQTFRVARHLFDGAQPKQLAKKNAMSDAAVLMVQEWAIEHMTAVFKRRNDAFDPDNSDHCAAAAVLMLEWTESAERILFLESKNGDEVMTITSSTARD